MHIKAYIEHGICICNSIIHMCEQSIQGTLGSDFSVFFQSVVIRTIRFGEWDVREAYVNFRFQGKQGLK